MFCASSHLLCTQEHHECRVQKNTWGMLLKAQGWWHVTFSLCYKALHCTLYGLNYLNLQLWMQINTSRCAKLQSFTVNLIFFFQPYLHVFVFLGHLYVTYLWPTNASPDEAVKGKALTRESLIFLLARLNWDFDTKNCVFPCSWNGNRIVNDCVNGCPSQTTA